MGSIPSWISRGRGVRSGLAIVLGTFSACQQGPPPGEPVDGYREPSISQQDGWTLVENTGPAETLLIYDDPPEESTKLLFLAGHSAPLTESGNVVPPPAGGPGAPPTTWEPGALASARDLFDFHLAPVRSGDPLLWVHDNETGERTPVGSATPPANAFLGQLFNTGWATKLPDGSTIFASAVRPELVAFDPEGDTIWVSHWQTPTPVEPPTFRVMDGSAMPTFSVVQFGLVAGQGGLLYVLAAPEPEVGPDHVLVFDHADGRLLRTGRIPQGSAVLADARGRVYVTSEEDAERWLGDPNRVPFAPFDLPTLGRMAERTTLEEHRGKVVVVNFWASWCAPCREEMPLLDAFARGLDPEQAVVVGLNEDVAPSAGLAFIEELGGVSYESGAGGGRLRREYNYRGLPYTIVLDRDLRVVKSFYGFGSSIDPIIDAVQQELDR